MAGPLANDLEKKVTPTPSEHKLRVLEGRVLWKNCVPKREREREYGTRKKFIMRVHKLQTFPILK
jgi:hypothetical protein